MHSAGMDRGDSPLLMKSRLLAIYGNYLSECLVRARHVRTANQLEGATLSVANNISEAQSPSSRQDFISKLKIAQREAYEAETVCVVTARVRSISPNARETMFLLIEEICKMLTASIATAKKNAKK